MVLLLVHGVSHASRCRQYTHATWLHSHCIIALMSWEAHLGFDELSESHIEVNPTDWAQVGQESQQVWQVSLHLFSSVPGMCKIDGDVAHIGCPPEQVMTVLMCVQSPYHAESSREKGEEHACM